MMLSIFVRSFGWGIVSMLGLVAFGLVYRYFFVSARLAVVPEVLWTMLVGAVGTGLSVVFTGMRVDEQVTQTRTRRMVQMAIQLIKTMLAAICIVSTLYAGGLVMKQMTALMRLKFAYSRVAAEVLVAAVLFDLGLFVIDLRDKRKPPAAG
jgi:hypothetical protein